MGLGIWYVGSGIGGSGLWRWCWVERGADVDQGAAGRWEAEETPLEIGEEAPLEVVAEAPLELEGERERMWGALAVGMVASSSGRGRGVG